MKTPEEVARDRIAQLDMSGSLTDALTSGWFNGDDVERWLAEAIEAARAQLEAEYAYQVVTGGTSRYPLAIVGAYRSEFEAKAVAKEWNRINNRYGIRYRVEVDS